MTFLKNVYQKYALHICHFLITTSIFLYMYGENHKLEKKIGSLNSDLISAQKQLILSKNQLVKAHQEIALLNDKIIKSYEAKTPLISKISGSVESTTFLGFTIPELGFIGLTLGLLFCWCLQSSSVSNNLSIIKVLTKTVKTCCLSTDEYLRRFGGYITDTQRLQNDQLNSKLDVLNTKVDLISSQLVTNNAVSPDIIVTLTNVFGPPPYL